MRDSLLAMPVSDVEIYRFGGLGEIQICFGRASIFASPRNCRVEPASPGELNLHDFCITSGDMAARLPITAAAEAEQLIELLTKLQAGGINET